MKVSESQDDESEGESPENSDEVASRLVLPAVCILLAQKTLGVM